MIWFFKTVFHNKLQIVALVEHFAIDVRVNGLKPFHLLVLLGNELLIHRRDLNEHVIVGEIEVGREIFGRLAIFIELNWEAFRLVIPRNAVEVEKKGELPLTVVSELDFLRREAIADQVTPASATPVYSAPSGNN